MTVIVGVLCEDGVVVGSDSSETLGNVSGVRTIEQLAAIKVTALTDTIITAITGEVGLGQRFNAQLNEMKANGSFQGRKNAVEYGTVISEATINNFKRTMSAMQHQPTYGWGLGALVGIVINDKPELIEFDPIQFHPERRGDPDASGRDHTSRIVSMGSGQPIADPFLGFIKRVFWAADVPKVKDAKLAVTWTLKHVIELNVGGVGGDIQLASIEKVAGNWKSTLVNPGEILGQVEDLEKYVASYRDKVLKEVGESPDVPTPRA